MKKISGNNIRNPIHFIGGLEKRVHLVGIGGIGLSALARWFRAHGWKVSGSDAVRTGITDSLRREKISVKIGHRPSNIPRGAGLVVRSQAIETSNPEYREAVRRGITVLSYPEALGELTRQYETAAVAGAHGKSTTTALLALMLVQAKLDPTVVVGTNLREFGGANFRNGKSPYLLIEADEYRDAFLRYSPSLAIVTNLDREHLDYFKNAAGVKKSFTKFLGSVREGGTVVANRDNPLLRSVGNKIEAGAKAKRVRVRWYSLKSPLARKVRRVLWLPGEHNLSNALAAYHAARALGVSERNIFSVFKSYRGAWRRMEYKGEFSIAEDPSSKPEPRTSNLKLYSDYAHHPTEIKATLQAFKERFPDSAVVCAYEPHQALRLKLLFDEFKDSFDDADVLLMLPAYRVSGRDRVSRGFTSESLVRAIQRRHPKRLAFFLPFPRRLKDALTALLPALKNFSAPPVVVLMGAGPVDNLAELLIPRKSLIPNP